MNRFLSVAFCALLAVLVHAGTPDPPTAEAQFREAMARERELLVDYARLKSDGEALTLLASLPQIRDAFLSLALRRKADPRTAHAEVWAGKGLSRA